MAKGLRSFIDWIGRIQTVQSILQIDFVRTALLPTLYAVMTGTAGYFGGIQLMWIMVAVAIVSASIVQLLLRGEEYRERKSPLNKLTVNGVNFACELAPAEILFPQFINRKQRRAQGAAVTPAVPHKLGASDCMPGVKRTLLTGQLAVQMKNTASFPISCRLWSAETEVATLKPPRSSFPKGASTVQSGSAFQVMDDIIDMENIPAGRLAGKIDMLLKYGLPGKEIYELKLSGMVDIVIEDFGLVKQVTCSWKT